MTDAVYIRPLAVVRLFKLLSSAKEKRHVNKTHKIYKNMEGGKKIGHIWPIYIPSPYSSVFTRLVILLSEFKFE